MPIGFARGRSFDDKRTNWDGDGPRPLAWSAWYPSVDEAVEKRQSTRSWFRAGPVARNAPLRRTTKPLPLVLLSHGTGGIAAGLEWLGHRLAQAGYVALGVNHHGNTAAEPYRAEGFLALWERAADLAALLDDKAWRKKLGGMVADEAFVAGFSAGGYTAMLALGARVAHSQFEADFPAKSASRGPREFPTLADDLPALLEQSAVFRRSWDRRTADHSDERFRAAFVLAPGRSVLGFAPASLAQIKSPIHLIGGGADTQAPVKDCAGWLHRNLPAASLEILPGVGHYTFLPEPTRAGMAADPAIFSELPGIDRRVVHDRVAEAALKLFSHGTAAISN
jgi:predicted dienelactone hydrolase